MRMKQNCVRVFRTDLQSLVRLDPRPAYQKRHTDVKFIQLSLVNREGELTWN